MCNLRQDYAAARDYFQQMIAICRVIGVQVPIAVGLINLADIDIKLGQLAEARAKLREALMLAGSFGYRPWAVLAIGNFSNLAHAEGQTERALALWNLARHHPALKSDDQHALDRMLAEWALDPSVAEAGLKKGEALDWDETVKELLKG
jgi:tetratricopeptide (TPR) repeat protein